MKKTVYYWSPCLTKVGTVKSTLNSAIALAKFNSNFEVRIINVFGEWTQYEEYLKKNNVKIKNLIFDYQKILPKYGFLQSRISYLVIIVISFFPLLMLLKEATALPSLERISDKSSDTSPYWMFTKIALISFANTAQVSMVGRSFPKCELHQEIPINGRSRPF